MRWIAGILIVVLMMTGASASVGGTAVPHAAPLVQSIDSAKVGIILPCEDCDDVAETCVRTACDTGITSLTIRRTPALVAVTAPLPPGTVKVSGLNPLPLSPPPKS